MNPLTWLNTGTVWAEVTLGILRVEHGGRSRDWALDRLASGALTEACRSRLVEELSGFLERKPWQPKGEVRCALPAAGVTLRRWKVPRGAEDETRKVLMLQIEAEIPLVPEDLPWGWMKLGEVGAMQEVVVAAVRKRSIEEYAEVFASCGLVPKFTLSALIRARALVARPIARGGEAWLEVGSEQSEWLVLDEAGPQRLRVIPWGERSIVRAWMERQGVSEDVARGWLDRIVHDPKALEEAGRVGWEAAVQALGQSLPSPMPVGQIHLTGRLGSVPGFGPSLEAGLIRQWEPEAPGTAEVGRVNGRSVSVVVESASGGLGAGIGVLQGMREAMERAPHQEGLWLATVVEESSAVMAQPAPRRWAVAAGLLLVGLLSTPYLEALMLYPGVAKRVASIRERQDSLKTIDRQSDFLRYLRQNQTPHLETLIVLGKTIPPGSKLESLNLNRKGEMSLRITVRQPQDAPSFRTKLTDSGFFSSVVIEEQSPAPDRQKVQVRISAQILPANQRQGLKILEGDPAPESKPGATPPGPAGAPPKVAGRRS